VPGTAIRHFRDPDVAPEFPARSIESDDFPAHRGVGARTTADIFSPTIRTGLFAPPSRKAPLRGLSPEAWPSRNTLVPELPRGG